MEFLPAHIYVVLFVAGICAGFVDSIAGGGGLISLPVLLWSGIPLKLALGTNKLQGSFGTFSASFNYIRSGVIRFNEVFTGVLFTIIGAAAGTFTIQSMDAGFLGKIIPALLIMVFFYTLFMKPDRKKSSCFKLNYTPFFMVAGLVLGFYDGFFGPGTGSFWTAAIMFFLPCDMKKASGFTRVMNLSSNVVALSLFILGENVFFSAGLAMASGQVIGALTGSRMAIKRGTRFIRPVFLVVVFLTIMRLGWKTYLS